MSHPLARLFGSLANVLLDLGLPTIKSWLRDRVGPEADVADVSTDGSVVRLRGLRIPLGPRGLLVLETAAATITSLGDDGPALRLRAFEGVLVFTRSDLRDAFPSPVAGRQAQAEASAHGAGPTFRAEISFTASDAPDPSAWIWGDLAIRRAIWTTDVDTPPAPLEGAARLFVSSRAWRLESGRLDGGPTTASDGKPPVVARFAAAGVLETTQEEEEVPLLVPRALTTLSFRLEHGRIGPFLQALTALAGEEAIRARIPPGVPRDTRLDGELAWSSIDGGRAELRLDAATIGARASVHVGFSPMGDTLTGRIDGTIALAALLRRFQVSPVAIPRDEDMLSVAVTLGGAVRAPEAQIDVTGAELGLRLGRPRFVPAVALRAIAGQAFVKDGRVVGRIGALARDKPVAVDLHGATADLAGMRVVIRADVLEVGFLRDVVRTLGSKLVFAEDANASVALTKDGAAPLSGTVTLAMGGSRLVAELGTVSRVTGGVKAEDVIATGLLEHAAVFPTQGDFVVALDVDDDLRARGSVAAAGKTTLAIGKRDVPLAYELEGAKVDVTIDRTGLTYEALRFTAYEGRFAGYGSVPFAARPTAPYLVLQLELGGAALADQLLHLARPRPAIDVPTELGLRGTLALAADLSFAIDLTLATRKGTELVTALRIARGGNMHGSTAHGAVALVDALVFARVAEPALEGLVTLDLDVVDRGARTIRGVVSAASIELPPVTLTDVSGEVVIGANGDVLWNRVAARLAGGLFASFGIARRDGGVSARVSAASVAVHELPPIENRTLGTYVRGRASGTVLGHRAANGTVEARGDIVLDEAAFPVIDRVRGTLARYGLRPPNEDATGPAVATLLIDARGARLADVAVDLHGAAVRATIDLSPARTLDGKVEIILEEEYLRTSKVLTLPRVLGERLVIPIAIGGTLARPDVKAELGQTLGRFLRESKVVDFVASAVEEAQLFFRKDRIDPPEPSMRRSVPVDTRETELRAAIDEHANDWAALATRR